MFRSLLTIIFILIDWLSASLSWGVFYYCRKTYIENQVFTVDSTFYRGIFLVPFIWIAIYLLQGTYYDVRRLYRLKIFSYTFFSSIVGTIILFFFFLLDDNVKDYQLYYKSILILFSIYFSFSFIPRIFLVSFIVKKVHHNKSGFRTLLIGGSEKAVAIYNEILNLPKGIGNQFVGFVNLNGVDKALESQLTYLGHVNNLDLILRENKIEEVIIALEISDHARLRNIISRIEGGNIKIKISNLY